MPFWLAIGTIVRHSGQIISWTENLATTGLPPPPSWLDGIPLLGSGAAHLWRDIANDDLPELLQKGRPYAGRITSWFIEAMGGLGSVLVQFLLTVAILAILARAEELAVHVPGALNHGVTREQVEEVMVQLTVYGGFPRAVEGMRSARAAFERIDARKDG